ncbi:glycosyltransferase family 9 protein [bacterium]|nr:glycosyltransferase family 9 protein [bacterium]
MKTIAFYKIRKPGGAVVSLKIDDVVVGNEAHVFTDTMAEKFQTSAWAPYIREINDIEVRQYAGEDLNGRTVLLWRNGGYGDLLMITPAIRELKRRYPLARIKFATVDRYRSVLAGNPDIDEIVSVPFPAAALSSVDFLLTFNNTIESSTDAALPGVDIFAARACVTLAADNRVPVYNVSPARADAIAKTLAAFAPVEGLPWVAIQMRASSPVRTYPLDALKRVAWKLAQSSYVFLFSDRPKDFTQDLRRAGIVNLCGVLPDMADVAAALAGCDALVAPDSSLVHYAAALGVPTIALYGPFPGAIRTKDYPLCTTLEVDRAAWPCAPCLLHGHAPCPKAVERGRRDSPCFETLPPRAVVAAVRDILANKKGQTHAAAV